MKLIHSDVFGPVPIHSKGGYLYYVSFIGYFYLNTCLYFLRKKSYVFKKYKDFKYLVENQIDKKMKVLRSDNGGELCGNDLDKFCKESGIEC
jgi:hypothetical protein